MDSVPAFVLSLLFLGVSADDVQWNLTSTYFFACDVTKVEGLYYNADNFYGPDRGQGATEGVNSLDDCMNRCFLNPKCLSVNHRKTDSFCEYHSTGVSDDVNESIKSNMARADADWVHYRIDDCPGEPSSTPVGCGKQASTYKPSFTRIIGGAQAKSHSWPWQTALTMTNDEGNSFTCGASLIRARDGAEESDILLTAGHCVNWEKKDPNSNATIDHVPYKPEEIKAIMGVNNREQYEVGAQVRLGNKIVAHPDYDPSHKNNDIALIRLAESVKFTKKIRPICLPKQDEVVTTGKSCAAAGWGRTSNLTQGWTTSADLKEVAVTIQDSNDCKNRYTSPNGDLVDADQMVCAGNSSGTDGTCMGDSGGMLACKNETEGTWVLQGATSWGAGICLQDNKPTVFARISNYVDWIEETVANITAVIGSSP